MVECMDKKETFVYIVSVTRHNITHNYCSSGVKIQKLKLTFRYVLFEKAKRVLF